MTKDETIEKLWEQSNHGTQREDIEAAYNAGATAEHMKWKSLCDQMGDALEYVDASSFKPDVERKIEYVLTAWRATKDARPDSTPSSSRNEPTISDPCGQ